jgi:hypothetical protein
MFRRPMTRLSAAIAVAGTVCALGAGSALAAPAAPWSAPSKPIPGALTNDSPALSSVTFPSPIGQGLMAAWRGRGTFGHVFYKYRTPTKKHRWSKKGEVPGALTSSAPAIAFYTDPLGKGAILAVWAGYGNNRIWYSQGQTKPGGTIAWTKPADIPTTVAYSTTFGAPAVFFPDHASNVMVIWRAPYNHVRYSIGTPAGRGFTWSQSAVVPGNPPSPTSAHCTIAPCTSAGPAVTEETTSTSTGQIFVFWKQLGTDDIFYSTTTDGPATNWSKLIWTGPSQVCQPATSTAKPSCAVTLTAPAVSVPSVNATGPLLLVYKAPYSTKVRYQTLSSSGWSAVGHVYGTRTAVAPALARNYLATTTPTTIGNIILRAYS